MKSWSDQPDFVGNGVKLLSFHADGRIVEIRANNEVGGRRRYFVTAGNLFGSQTLETPDLESAVKLIDFVLHDRGKKATMERLARDYGAIEVKA